MDRREALAELEALSARAPAQAVAVYRAAEWLCTLRTPAIAGAVWGSLFGIQVQRLLDPEFDAAAAVDALAALALR